MTVFARAAELYDPPPDPYVDDPVGWASTKLDAFLWSGQREVVESVRDHRYTAVHSAHDLGKSFAAALIAAWWIDTHPPGEAFVVSTAPTFAQVRAILWREINRAHKKGGLVGTVNQTEWWLDDEIVAFGRKPADTDPAAFQGIHARYVLIIIDEACGVPKAIFDAVDSLATNEHARVLAIGNPDDATSHFADICKPGSGWHVIHLDGLESPNFTDEKIPDYLRALLLGETWVAERVTRWGVDSALYISKVRGVFPEDAEDGVVRASKVAQCRIAQEGLVRGDLLPVELGVDVGAGGDQAVIRERRGIRAGRRWGTHTRESMHLVGMIVGAILETGATAVKVDAIGIGWGVVGRLEELRAEGAHSAAVIGVNVGERSTAPKKHPRLRDQIWWEIARGLSETGGWDLSNVDDDTIVELLAPRYSIDSAGRVKVEPKEETRARLGRSPDDADALLLAYYVGGATSIPPGSHKGPSITGDVNDLNF